MERPSSQLSYLDHFLQETGGAGSSSNIYNNASVLHLVIMQIFKFFKYILIIFFIKIQHHPASSNAPSQKPINQLSQSAQQHTYSNQASNYSLESDDLDIDGNLSISSSKSDNLSDNSMEHNTNMPPKQKVHQFLVRTFSTPSKCNHCTSLMIGLTRQGVVCELCGFACHMVCCQKVPTQCPVPADQTRPQGIDPTKGIGKHYFYFYFYVNYRTY